jgi:hypothetical protein
MVLAAYVGFSRLSHMRFIEREPMLTGILKVVKLPPQSTFWRFLASLRIQIAGQILRVQAVMRQRVWEAAHVDLSVVTLDTDTTNAASLTAGPSHSAEPTPGSAALPVCPGGPAPSAA